jgi:phosphoglycolate phosphatase-like HAD superfamily hydrolase
VTAASTNAATRRPALVLFDIDGTLLLSGGAGVRSMALAFEDVFGTRDAFAGISIAGRTDTYLVSLALQRAGIPDTASAHAQFRERYLEILGREIHHQGSHQRGLMPGVRELLDELARDENCHKALLTGNYELAAHIKLSHFAVDGFFTWGAFGEDSDDRGELARLAVQRAAQRGVPSAARANVVVIGDTPHDIACARAIAARVVAVATGGYSEQQLQSHGADFVTADLSATADIVDFIARGGCGGP